MASNPYQAPGQADAVTPKRTSRALIAVGIVGVAVVAIPICLCVGLLSLMIAQTHAYHEQFLREQALITPVLSSDPAFKDLESHEYSGGGAYIMGRVDREEDIENLVNRLAATLGEQRADEIVRGVYTREQEQEWNEELTSPLPPSPHPQC